MPGVAPGIDVFPPMLQNLRGPGKPVATESRPHDVRCRNVRWRLPAGHHRCTVRHCRPRRRVMITLLHEQSETPSKTALVKDEDLWISPHDLEQATGWSMKPEGFCLGDVCVPVPAGERSRYVDGDRVNAAAFWKRLGNPVVHDASGEIWVLGTGAS